MFTGMDCNDIILGGHHELIYVLRAPGVLDRPANKGFSSK